MQIAIRRLPKASHFTGELVIKRLTLSPDPLLCSTYSQSAATFPLGGSRSMDDESARSIWQAALGRLQLQITRPNYDTWLKDTVGLRWDNGSFVVGAPSDFATHWLTSKMRSRVSQTVSAIVGRAVEVSFALTLPAPNAMPAASPLFAEPHPIKQAPSSRPLPRGHLNPLFTFQRFIVGESNRLAAAAALAAAGQPGQVYNPLFIFGPQGLGKTHLLQAIGHHAYQRGHTCLYVTCERFTNDFISALGQGHLDEFRRTYRSPDILLIDDIQFLAGKQRTHQEFLYTFNELHAAGHQVVISADRTPQGISGVEASLRSRFQAGLVADILPPDLETRMVIIQAKAHDLRLRLSQDIVRSLATRLQGNVRDLEGSLNRLLCISRLNRTPLTLQLVHQALAALTPEPPTATPSPQAILHAVSSYFHIAPAIITGQSRAKHVSDARHIAMFLLREDAKYSLKEIGLAMGHRDHSTVIHAYQKITALLTRDPELKHTIAELRSTIASS